MGEAGEEGQWIELVPWWRNRDVSPGDTSTAELWFGPVSIPFFAFPWEVLTVIGSELRGG